MSPPKSRDLLLESSLQSGAIADGCIHGGTEFLKYLSNSCARNPDMRHDAPQTYRPPSSPCDSSPGSSPASDRGSFPRRTGYSSSPCHSDASTPSFRRTPSTLSTVREEEDRDSKQSVTGAVAAFDRLELRDDPWRKECRLESRRAIRRKALPAE